MDGGCLADVLRRVGAIPEGVLSRITARVLQGLAFLHRRHLVGRGGWVGAVQVPTGGAVSSGVVLAQQPGVAAGRARSGVKRGPSAPACLPHSSHNVTPHANTPTPQVHRDIKVCWEGGEDKKPGFWGLRRV
jgi:serine/threonine protein kinase